MRRRLVPLLLAGCHVTAQTETTRPGATEHIVHAGAAVARPPALVLTSAGVLRFIEPLACPTEQLVHLETTREIATRPNLATFVVGVIATAVGGVMTVGGVTDDTGRPLTYAGITGVVVGLPLAIGPWLGNHLVLGPGAPRAPLRRPGPSAPCGARPLAARAATLLVRGIEVHGAIDREGTFAISPYQVIDAYDATELPGWEVTARVETDAGERTISTVLDAGALASAAHAFLSRADFGARIEPLRLVPGVGAGSLRVSLTTTALGPALRVVLRLHNDGPGDAWALRGRLTSSTRAIDGRMIYVGHVPKATTVARELLIPLTGEAAAQLRGASLELAIELRDAHGTAPATPVRFHGAVLGDAPR